MPFSREDVDRAVSILERLAREKQLGGLDDLSDVAVFKEALKTMNSPLFAQLVEIQQQLGQTIESAKEWNEAVHVDTSFDAETEQDFQQRYGLLDPEDRQTVSGLERVGTPRQTLKDRRWSDDWVDTEVFTGLAPRQPLGSLDSSLAAGVEKSLIASALYDHQPSLPKSLLESTQDSSPVATRMTGSESPSGSGSASIDSTRQQAECERFKRAQLNRSREEISPGEDEEPNDDVFLTSTPDLQRRFPPDSSPNVRTPSAHYALSKRNGVPSQRADVSTHSAAPKAAHTSHPLKDSLYFLRNKQSLSEVMKAANSRQERRLSLVVESDGLGIFLVGSVQHGIFIDSVSPHSRAEEAGCHHGDQLLAINDHSFEHRSLDEVVEFVKTVSTGEQIQLILHNNVAGLDEFKRDTKLNR